MRVSFSLLALALAALLALVAPAGCLCPSDPHHGAELHLALPHVHPDDPARLPTGDHLDVEQASGTAFRVGASLVAAQLSLGGILAPRLAPLPAAEMVVGRLLETDARAPRDAGGRPPDPPPRGLQMARLV